MVATLRGVGYLAPVKSVVKYTALCLLHAASAAFSPAGQHERSESSAIFCQVSSDSATDQKATEPQPDFRQAKYVHSLLRVDGPPNAILVSDVRVPSWTIVWTSVDSLIEQSALCVYLRYRPRDPPVA